MKFKRVVIGMVLAALVQGSVRAGESHTVHIQIDRLSCECCAQKIHDRLASFCKEYSVDLPKKVISCRYEDPVTAKQITSAIHKIGFDTKIVSD